MDFEKALKEFEGDRALLMEVLGGFLENVRMQVGVIRKSLMSEDPDRVQERGAFHKRRCC